MWLKLIDKHNQEKKEKTIIIWPWCVWQSVAGAVGESQVWAAGVHTRGQTDVPHQWDWGTAHEEGARWEQVLWEEVPGVR